MAVALGPPLLSPTRASIVAQSMRSGHLPCPRTQQHAGERARETAIPTWVQTPAAPKTHTRLLRDGDARTCGHNRPSRGPARHDNHVALCVSEEGVVVTSQEHTGRVSDPADVSIGTSVLCRVKRSKEMCPGQTPAVPTF